MELIHRIYPQNLNSTGCVLTIGNFDGFHLGHQSLLASLIEQGRQRDLPAAVLVFEPQPLEFFSSAKRDAPPARLTALRDKVTYFCQAGVDILWCAHFNHAFAQLTAEQFVEQILVKQLNVRYLLVGDDFRFGRARQGDFALLSQLGKKWGFVVANSQTFCYQNQRVSSTAIRQALQQDNLALAQALLGHPYQISGKVVHGDKRGRLLGTPTANLLLKPAMAAVSGVYAVEVLGISDQPLPAVANIGVRPTVAGTRRQLEVYILNFSQDLYGKVLSVVLRHKIRDEQRFASLEALKQQISQDVAVACAYFQQSIVK